MPRSAEECRVVPGRGGADIGEPLNYYHCNTTKIDGLWCREVPRSAEECRVALLPLKYHSNGKGRAAEDGLWYRGLPSGTV